MRVHNLSLMDLIVVNYFLLSMSKMLQMLLLDSVILALIGIYMTFRCVYEECPTSIKQHGWPEFIITGLVIDISMKVLYLDIRLCIQLSFSLSVFNIVNKGFRCYSWFECYFFSMILQISAYPFSWLEMSLFCSFIFYCWIWGRSSSSLSWTIINFVGLQNYCNWCYTVDFGWFLI